VSIETSGPIGDKKKDLSNEKSFLSNIANLLVLFLATKQQTAEA
jgi:hypothetical protein